MTEENRALPSLTELAKSTAILATRLDELTHQRQMLLSVCQGQLPLPQLEIRFAEESTPVGFGMGGLDDDSAATILHKLMESLEFEVFDVWSKIYQNAADAQAHIDNVRQARRRSIAETMLPPDNSPPAQGVEEDLAQYIAPTN